MRIIYMGTPDIAVPVLEMLIHGDEQLIAVVSQPDRPKGRGRKLARTPVKKTAKAHGIPVLQPENANTDKFREQLKELKPNLILVMAYGQILRPEIIDLPAYGCINLHTSLLPKYRGAAPIQWAIINGDMQTGVTAMQMDQGMDTGGIIKQLTVPIDDCDTAGTLHDKLAQAGAELMVEVFEDMKTNPLEPIPQDNGKACYAPMLKKQDGQIDWRLPAQVIRNRIRALDPWPGSYTFLSHKRLVIWSAELADGKGEPGLILEAGPDGLVVACKEGALKITECQPSGKRRMSSGDYQCGNLIEPGMKFENGE